MSFINNTQQNINQAAFEAPLFRAIGATTYVSPVPVVLVGCANPAADQKPNLITIAWAGICCSSPPMLSISIRKERHSYALIEKTGEFTVNLVGESLLHAVDFCGVKSGRSLDKFDVLGLHPIPAAPLTYAPALAESPAHLCCQVKEIIPLGTHDLFLANIMQVCVQDQYFMPDGSIDEKKMKLLAYVHGKYRMLSHEVGFFGFSIAGKDVLARRMPKEKN